MLRLLLIILFLTFCIYSFGQDTTRLESYIKIGLENNIALKQKQASYNKSIAVLKEANALFYPSVSLNARYTWADGGRVIDLPVGDMLNPVYSTLNDMTELAYQVGLASEIFPDTSIQNESIQFLRDHEQETKAELIQPIFNSDIFYNRKIKKGLIAVERADIVTYKYLLIAEIKKAYYTYLKVLEFSSLLGETEQLALENLRVNQKLFENDKITIDNVYRSKSEISKLKQLQASTEKDLKLSQAYFNFLLNQPKNTEIEIDEIELFSAIEFDVNDAKTNAIENRQEIQKIESYKEVVNSGLKLNQYSRLPDMFAVVDYGFQGEEYNFTSDDDFVMASLVMKWDIFSGFSKNAKIQQAKIDQYILELKQEELISKIEMEVVQSVYELKSSLKSIENAKDEVKYTASAFKIINKKYLEGQISLLEYIDAQTNLTNSKKNLIIRKYDYLIKVAEYERVIAFNEFDKE